MKELQELKELRQELDGVENEAAKVEGRLEELKKNLKENFGVETVEDAEQLLTSMRDKTSEMEAELVKEFEQLKKEFKW